MRELHSAIGLVWQRRVAIASPAQPAPSVPLPCATVEPHPLTASPDATARPTPLYVDLSINIRAYIASPQVATWTRSIAPDLPPLQALASNRLTSAVLSALKIRIASSTDNLYPFSPNPLFPATLQRDGGGQKAAAEPPREDPDIF